MCETGRLVSAVSGVWNLPGPGHRRSGGGGCTMPWFLVLILVAVLDALPVDVSCVRLDDIYWNTSNPIFVRSPPAVMKQNRTEQNRTSEREWVEECVESVESVGFELRQNGGRQASRE
uniref:Ephrin RBD domain-containing protein n=1 Tax=Strigamia maritima TaxID=126957 RepID=T1JC47_STRMM